MIANVEDPVTAQPLLAATRATWPRRPKQYVKDSGVGDTVYIGPELEFFLFDEVRFASDQHSAFYSVDSDEGIWNSGAETTLRGDLNQGYRPRYKEGYFPVSPHDTQTDIRNEMVEIMEACGIQIELHHHEVATAGQGEIDMRFDTLTKMGDKSLLYKYIVKNVAKRHGKVATFMPKPLFQDNGSGMHTHLSIWRDGANLFAGDEYAGVSQDVPLVHRRPHQARQGAHGHRRTDDEQLQAARPGLRSAGEPGVLRPQPLGGLPHPARQPGPAPEARRVPPAGPDRQPVPHVRGHLHGRHGRHHERDGSGRRRSTRPTSSTSARKSWRTSRRSRSRSKARSRRSKRTTTSCSRAASSPRTCIETWIAYKYENEVDPVRMRPHPYEFHLYFDA